MSRPKPGWPSQAGAALIEFAVTVSLFLLLVLATMEFTLLVLDMSRANEMTRQLSRIALTADPVCDIWPGGAGDCPGGAVLDCTSVPPLPAPPPAVTVDLSEVDTNGCTEETGPTGCRMFDQAENILPGVAEAQIEISYACSNTSFAERPFPVPLVSVSLQNFSRPFLFAGFLGLQTAINYPEFEVTRLGEDLYTERQL